MIKFILTCVAEYCAGLLGAVLLVAIILAGVQLT